MAGILTLIKNFWNTLNKISPETRTLIIIFLFGYILYSLITDSTKEMITNKFLEELLSNKKAELYSLETSIEINRQVLLILEKDEDAFDILLLNYHNNTLSLQGYKYLYLSCLTEAPRSLDTPLLKTQWNRIDYVYYAEELFKIHNQNFVLINNIENIKTSLPKLYRLVKASDAKAISFFTIQGHTNPIGMIVVLYKEERSTHKEFPKEVLPCILKLAILLDYENIKK